MTETEYSQHQCKDPKSLHVFGRRWKGAAGSEAREWRGCGESPFRARAAGPPLATRLRSGEV